MREGIIDELSVGFDWVKWEEQRTDDGLLIVHRQARLREISVVTFGALGRNARAMTVNSAPKRQGSSVTSWRERFARLDS
jgi:HK97 family phage prohead protease